MKKDGAKYNREIQTAFVSGGFGICGFDHLKVRKQGITANNKQRAH
jgi:hypothetical protein